MILFDINSFPDGLDLSVWMDLIDKNIMLFDSKNNSEIPFIAGKDADKVSFIDINSMTEKDLEEIAIYLKNRNTEDQEKAKIQLETARINNEKLIKYLHNINEEYK